VGTAPQTSRRIGYHRWLIILVIVLSVLAARAVAPVTPHIQVPAEPLTGELVLPVLGPFRLTNTMVATLLADVVLIGLALAVRRSLTRAKGRSDAMLGGLAGVMEAIVEPLHRLVETTAGRMARTAFPWVATIVLMVLVVNWMELFPGVDSIGVVHEAHASTPAYEVRELTRLGSLPVVAITGEHESGSEGEGLGFVPFVRVASTDLNFTLALALAAVVMSQVVGLRAAGPGYLKKFFNFGGLGKMLFQPTLGPFGLLTPFVNVFVGVLELVAEFAKIISFSFRLFGNVFAGSVLLFVIGSLVPVMVQSGFLILEMFVGLVQALVFGILTLVFMTMAAASHDAQGQKHDTA
jgi:F-type H+-transporting ATPase subunit a